MFSCDMSKHMHEYSFLPLPKKIFTVYLAKVCTQQTRVYISRASHNLRPRSYISGRKIFDKSHFLRLITGGRGIAVRIDINLIEFQEFALPPFSETKVSRNGEEKGEIGITMFVWFRESIMIIISLLLSERGIHQHASYTHAHASAPTTAAKTPGDSDL